MNEKIIVLDFGGQYSLLVARRIRESGVYSEIFPWDIDLNILKEKQPSGIILVGDDDAENAPNIDHKIFELGVPVLGICYGAELIAKNFDGNIVSKEIEVEGENGCANCHFESSKLFENLPEKFNVFMGHSNSITSLPAGFSSIAHTNNFPFAAFSNSGENIYGVQFHPEVTHTENGLEILRNFLHHICKISSDWNMSNYVTTQVAELREKIGNKKVLLGLSGGVDSSVTAALLSRAIGKNLTCVFIDHGFMRKNEGKEVKEAFGNGEMNFVAIDASGRFLGKVRGVTDPEQKRKIIGAEFASVFEDEAKRLSEKEGKIDFLAQGTIYPDIIESGVSHIGGSAKAGKVIKSHHNVGGLPEKLGFSGVIEPLRLLFKDEVRKLGLELGLSENLIHRQPFPGPGLAIRVIGEITAEKLDILREVDFIFRDELTRSKIPNVAQCFAIITNTRTVGVTGDSRTYDYVVALRSVATSDFMTADFSRIPYDVLEHISLRIVNEVEGVNRVVYDVTSKPPATIEWE